MTLRPVDLEEAVHIDDLEAAKSLPEAIRILRRRAGSHDKLAAKLGTSRKTIIGWEQGVWPREYLGQLRDEGVPGRLLIRSVTPDDLDARARQMEAELAALREEIERLR